MHTELEVFAFIVCTVLLFDTYQHKSKRFLTNHLYIALLLSNMALLLLDIASWVLDGRAGAGTATILMVVMVLYYVLNISPPFVWALYTDYQVFKDISRFRKLMWIFLIPAFVNIALILLTPFTGLFFYFDSSNVYHRGPGFALFVSLSFAYFIYAFILVLIYRKQIEKRIFLPLILFSLPPFIGGILQAFIFGLALTWTGITISLLIVHLYIQNRRLNTDYLTGIYNRQQLDRYLHAKIRNSDAAHGFSAILLDIDEFKKINDQYGHLIGDEALTITAQLLRNSLRKNDFLARYGGDEFFIIVDIQDQQALEKTVERIHESFRDFNQNSDKPYNLSMSMGYDIYNPKIAANADDFLRHIDALMYEDKRHKLQAQGCSTASLDSFYSS